MKTTTKKLRPPTKRHGGKAYLARRIIALFPEHQVYIEPFLGAGSILLNKPRSEREIVGDLDGDLMHFWEMLQDFPGELGEMLASIPYSEASWREWRTDEAIALGSIERAASYLVRNRFSRGGLGRDFAWSERLRGKRRKGGPVPGDVNAWDTIRCEMPAIAERIKGVVLNRCDAIELVELYDSPDSLTYLDPPYLHETRTHTKAYAHEMTREQHEELLGVLLGCEGRVFLSGYANPLYDAVLSGWKRHSWDLPNNSGQGRVKQRRLECVWEKPC